LESRSIRERIYAFIVEELNDGLEFDGDADLIQQGWIDSIGVMKLLEFMEASFGVEIDLEAIAAEDFQSLESLEGFVERLQGDA